MAARQTPRRWNALPVVSHDLAWSDLGMDWVRSGEDRDRVVTRDGVLLSSARTGDGKPHVLWLHGGPGMFDYLAPAATALRNGTHVRFDQRGCGRSYRSGPFSLERYLDDIADVARHYGCHRR